MSSAATGTPGISGSTRAALRSGVLGWRGLLEGDVERVLRRLGVVEPSEQAPGYLDAGELGLREVVLGLIAKERSAGLSQPDAVGAVVREVAYTHLNRLVGLRCLELRGHLVVGNESTEVITRREEFGGRSRLADQLRDGDRSFRSGPDAEQRLWQAAIEVACGAVTAEVGVLFDPEDPYGQVWPSHRVLMEVIDGLNNLPEDAFRADELLGWVYQYFQTEEKDRVFEEVRTKRSKIGGADLPAATQLFTERYMVEFLLQNSLGARWMQMYPDSPLSDGWDYYVQPATPIERDREPVRDWTVLDPCVGSGHFLVVAFELLVQLYAEERRLADEGQIPDAWVVDEADMAATIVGSNLFGIDIDPRAVQLAALALYLKAKEHGLEQPVGMNLVAADAVLTRGEGYQQLLDRYRDDPAAHNAIEAVWSALENVRELGSLVRISEAVDLAIETASPSLQQQDWDTYRTNLIDNIRHAVETELDTTDDITSRLFATETHKGLRLWDLLSRHYTIVTTNPPYMGSKNMTDTLKGYVSRHYNAGRRDLYAAFILLCRARTQAGGTYGLVTRQSWMFLSTFSTMRVLDEADHDGFRGLLEERLQAVGHLGTNAFEEISGEVVNVALFTAAREPRKIDTEVAVVRATDLPGPGEKAKALTENTDSGGRRFEVPLSRLEAIPGSPFVYWAPRSLLDLLVTRPSAGRGAGRLFAVRDGMNTGDNDRFVRYWWEVLAKPPWKPISKGGGYARWTGSDRYSVAWGLKGEPIKEADLPGTYLRNEDRYFEPLLCYTLMAQGSLGVRLLDDSAFDGTGLAIDPSRVEDRAGLAAYLNTYLTSYFCRLLSQSEKFRGGYVERVPRPPEDLITSLRGPGQDAFDLKLSLVRGDPTERAFDDLDEPIGAIGSFLDQACQLHELEASFEDTVLESFGLERSEAQAVYTELGTPVAWHQVDDGSRVDDRALLGITPLPEHTRSEAQSDDEDVAWSPVPADSALEEVASRLGVHPRDVLEQCQQLEARREVPLPWLRQAAAADWVSVLVLRLLGHRWPMQDHYEQERGEPFLDPQFVDPDGLVPLTPGMGEPVLAERVRRILEHRFGSEDAHRVERELGVALGWKPGSRWADNPPVSLERWLVGAFFSRHVSQFNRRPVAWQLSSAKGTLSVLAYYHGFGRDRLKLLRARYVNSALDELRRQLGQARDAGDDRTALAKVEQLETKVDEVEQFDHNLARLEEGSDTEAQIWCPWKDDDQQPSGWEPDIDDGIRVNIAPVQRLGLLADKALTTNDLNKLDPTK